MTCHVTLWMMCHMLSVVSESHALDIVLSARSHNKESMGRCLLCAKLCGNEALYFFNPLWVCSCHLVLLKRSGCKALVKSSRKGSRLDQVKWPPFIFELRYQKDWTIIYFSSPSSGWVILKLSALGLWMLRNCTLHCNELICIFICLLLCSSQIICSITRTLTLGFLMVCFS